MYHILTHLFSQSVQYKVLGTRESSWIVYYKWKRNSVSHCPSSSLRYILSEFNNAKSKCEKRALAGDIGMLHHNIAFHFCFHFHNILWLRLLGNNIVYIKVNFVILCFMCFQEHYSCSVDIYRAMWIETS